MAAGCVPTGGDSPNGLRVVVAAAPQFLKSRYEGGFLSLTAFQAEGCGLPLCGAQRTHFALCELDL